MMNIFFVRIGHTIRSVVCLQVVVAGHIDFVTDVAAGHYGASVTEPESANVCLHFLDILCDVVDLLCEGLDDLLSLIDGMASEHDNDEDVQDGALQATLGLQHRQVVMHAEPTASNVVVAWLCSSDPVVSYMYGALWWSRACWLGGGTVTVQLGARQLLVGRHGAFGRFGGPGGQ